jgi:hypothetical protein
MDSPELLHEPLRSRKTWDNTTLRLRIGDAEIQQRSIEAELRKAAEHRLEPQAPKKGRRVRRRRHASTSTW